MVFIYSIKNYFSSLISVYKINSMPNENVLNKAYDYDDNLKYLPYFLSDKSKDEVEKLLKDIKKVCLTYF